jgi:hypothetical protein
MFLTPAHHAAIRQRCRAGEPLTARIAQRAAAVPRDNLEHFITGRAVTQLLTGKGAGDALAAWRDWVNDWSPSDLRRSAQALHGCVVRDCCPDDWTAADTDRLAKLHESFRHPGPGNPHQIGNNWWAITHSAAYLTARATGHTDGAAWAAGRLRAFCQHFGEAGLYHEGLGYQAYTLSLLLPALLVLGEWPECFRRMALSLYATAVNRPPLADSDQPVEFGAMLSWNDAGQGWPQSNITSLLIALADPAHRGGLRTLFDRLSGETLAPGSCGWFFHLFCYPFDTPATDPNTVLPRSVCDSRQGLAVFRNRYQDAHDAVLGVYARVTHVGGHSQDDAGSIRFMALGHDWILGGGQARGDAEWQSVVTPVHDAHRPKNGCGHVLWYDPAGIFGMDLRKVHGGYSERYVAIRWPGTVALLDLIDDHRTDRTWAWNLTFAPHLRCDLRADGFDLLAPDGVNLRAQFLGAIPERLTVERMPDSQRTYSGGATVRYPGRPYLRAHFARQEHLGIYVILTVQAGAPPTIQSAGHLDVRVGADLWPRPFGAAIPANFELGRRGGLCKSPAG